MNPKMGGEQASANYESGALPPAEQANSEPEAVESPRSPESSATQTQAAPIIPIQDIPAVSASSFGPVDQVDDATDDNKTPSQSASLTSKLEKQMVERAKAVIAQTRDDPFKQKNEVSKVKAAYIEKKFNKKLKIDDAITK